MDKFAFARQIKEAEPVQKVQFIEDSCRDRTVLDLGCIRHNADVALADPNWLHQKIKTVAKSVVGIDYLADEINKLNDKGYSIRFADVTKPFFVGERFDVIVIGDLIEHLSNFDALFENCKKHLNPDGILIITTPNPFYTDEFFYITWKRNFLMNPEHVCWIDPYAMAQLAERKGFEISEIHFIKNSWSLPGIVSENEQHPFDVLNDRWTNETLSQEIKRHIMSRLFTVFYYPVKILLGLNTVLVRYSDYLIVLKQRGIGK
jgi:SAM-dependent methyltransferase